MSLDERLAALEVAWPEEPDVAPRVRARLEEAGDGRRPAGTARGRRPRGRRAAALAALVMVLGGIAAVPSARSTVLDWLGLGGEKIERVPKAPSPTPTPLDLGTRIPLPRGALVPRALGRPDAVYEAGDIVTLLYRPRPGLPESEHTGTGALLSQFPGRTRAVYVRKQAGPNTKVDRVTVRGEPGYWIAGAAHGLLYEDPSGAVHESRPRLAGRALVWRRGGRTLRLEADISESRALAIARSIR